jgi:hypothetical protein
MGRSTEGRQRLSEQRKYRTWTAQQKIEIVLAVWGKETRLSRRLGAGGRPAALRARVMRVWQLAGEADLSLRLARRSRASARHPGRNIRACEELRCVLGPTRACHCCDGRSGAAVESQGEGTAATRDDRGRPGTGPENHDCPAPLVESSSAATSRAAPCGAGALRAHTLPPSPPLGSEGRPAPSMPCAWARRKLGPARADPARRRPQPRDSQHGRDRGAETLIPSFSSSPWMRT